MKSLDPKLFWPALAASLLGLIAIADAGYAQAAEAGNLLPGEVLRQSIFILVSLGLAVVASLITPNRWKKLAPLAFWVSLGLLLLVHVPGLGRTLNGATRWVAVGPFSLQPSEFVKLGAILMLAVALYNRKPWEEPVRPPRNLGERLGKIGIPKLERAIPFVGILVLVVLIERQPDLATGAIILVVGIAMYWMSGMTFRSLATIGIFGSAILAASVWLEPYRFNRFINHSDRWLPENLDGIGFQSTIAETAMANGGLFGVGLGEGRAKHTLPMPTSDFIMATIGEEFGLLGVVAIISLLAVIVVRLFQMAYRQEDKFAKLAFAGVAGWIAVQAAVNLMMANGTFPPIGIPMPFISYGGSSLVALWMSLGICSSLAKAPSPKEEPAPRASQAVARRQRKTRKPALARR
jgi:cell division protein FtsW